MGVENARGRAVQYGIGQFAKQEGNMAAHQVVRVKNFVPGRQTMRLSGLRRGLMLGGSAMAFIFVAPQFAQAQTPATTPAPATTSVRPTVPSSTDLTLDANVTAQEMSTLVGANEVAIVGALLGSGGYSPRSIAGHETLTGALFIAADNSQIVVGGASQLTTVDPITTAGDAANVLNVTGESVTLYLDSGAALIGGAGLTAGKGGDAINVAAASGLTIIGPGTGSAALTGGAGVGAPAGKVGGDAIDAGGVVNLIGNVNLTPGTGVAAINKGAAIRIAATGGFTSEAGSKIVIIGGAVMADSRAGILLDAAATTAGAATFAGQSFANTYNLHIGGDLSVEGTTTLEGALVNLVDATGAASVELEENTALIIGSPGGTIDLGAGLVGANNALLGKLGDASNAGKLGAGSAIVLRGTITGGNAASTVTTGPLINSVSATDTLQVVFSKAHIALTDSSVAASRNIIESGTAAAKTNVFIQDSTIVLNEGDKLVNGIAANAIAVDISGDSSITSVDGEVFGVGVESVDISPGPGNTVTLDLTGAGLTANLFGGAVKSSYQLSGGGTVDLKLAAGKSVVTFAANPLAGPMLIGAQLNVETAVNSTTAANVSKLYFTGGDGLNVVNGGGLNVTGPGLATVGGAIAIADGAAVEFATVGQSSIDGAVNVNGGTFTAGQTGSVSINGAVAVNSGGKLEIGASTSESTITGALSVEGKGSVVRFQESVVAILGDLTIGDGTTAVIGGGRITRAAASLKTDLVFEEGSTLILNRGSDGELLSMFGSTERVSIDPGTKIRLSGLQVSRGADGKVEFGSYLFGNDDAATVFANGIVSATRGSVFNTVREGSDTLTVGFRNRIDLKLSEGDYGFLQEIFAAPLRNARLDVELLDDTERASAIGAVSEYYEEIVNADIRTEEGTKALKSVIRQLRPDATGDATITVAGVAERNFDVVSERVLAARSQDAGITLAHATDRGKSVASASSRGVAGAADSMSVGRTGSPSTWEQTFYTYTQADDQDSAAGYVSGGIGAAAGVDVPVAGVARAGGALNVTFTGADGNGVSDVDLASLSFGGTVYGHYDVNGLGQPGPFVAGMLGYTLNYNQTERELPIIDGSLAGEFFSHTGQVRLESGYRFTVQDRYVFDPYIGARLTHVTTEGYHEVAEKLGEQSEHFALRIKRSNYNAFESVMGFRLAANFGNDEFGIAPTMSAAWVHDFRGEAVQTDASFLSADPNQPTFRVKGRTRGQEAFQAGLGMNINMGETGFRVGVNGSFREDESQYHASGTFRYSF